MNFWINIPVRILNVFGRLEDPTNNAQEEYNSKLNKKLNVTHPRPRVLLCNLRSQIVLTEDKFVSILGGLKKPAQRKTYRELGRRRLRLNKAFVGFGSCDNVQTERKIFEYANWPRLQIKRTGPSSWSVQLVRPAGLSS